MSLLKGDAARGRPGPPRRALQTGQARSAACKRARPIGVIS